MEKYDLIIVGAGITGLSTAYHILDENRDMKIKIVERAPTFAQGNTAKSDAAFRDIFTSDINYKLSSSSINFYKHIQEDLKFNLGMKFNGYLFLLDEKNMESETVKKITQKTESILIEKEDISRMGFKTSISQEISSVMNLKNIAGGLLGKNCGILEPDLISSFYESELRKMGAEFSYNTTVRKLSLEPVVKLDFPGEPFIWQDKTIGHLETNKGDMFADNYLLATDVWTNYLLDPIGIDSHIRPKKRQVFQVAGKGIRDMVMKDYRGDPGLFPFTILPGPMIDMRPDPRSESFWISFNDDIGRDFSLEDDPVPEMDFYEKNLLTVIREYLPIFNESKVNSSWAGYYSMNTIDGTYYIFKELNVGIITGSSGSGIMKGDAAGRIAGAMMLGNKKARLYGGKEIDVDDLGIKKRNVQMENLII